MPSSLTPQEIGAAVEPPIADCCFPAPPVLEFDPEGKVLRTSGGPRDGYTWYDQEHRIYIDHNGFVWTGTSNGFHVMKFTQDGKHVLTIGEPGVNRGSHDPDHLGGPANFYVEPRTNEIFITDGYRNRRVVGIVRLRARVAQWANEQSRAELSRLPIPIRDHQPRRMALLPIRSQLPGR